MSWKQAPHSSADDIGYLLLMSSKQAPHSSADALSYLLIMISKQAPYNSVDSVSYFPNDLETGFISSYSSGDASFATMRRYVYRRSTSKNSGAKSDEDILMKLPAKQVPYVALLR